MTHRISMTQAGNHGCRADCSCGWYGTADTSLGGKAQWESVEKRWRDHVDLQLKAEAAGYLAPARVKDPAGRVDWLLSQLIKEAAEKSTNPLVRDAYGMFQADIDALLAQHLGPKNRTLKPIRRAIKLGRKVYAQRSTYRRKTA